MKRVKFEKGMPIETRFATHDGYLWHPAEITAVNGDFLWVRYASGHVKKIDRRDEERYRVPQVKRYG